MENFEVKMLSSLSKVFPEEIYDKREISAGTSFCGEIYSFQLAYRPGGIGRARVKVKVESALREHILLFEVENAPSLLPAYPESRDGDYLKTSPGLYPDILNPLPESPALTAVNNVWKSLWVMVNVPEGHRGGEIPITITFEDCGGNKSVFWTGTFTLGVIGAPLPENELFCTEWFHCDCLADYYGAKVFSGDHWRIIDNYLKNYVMFGMNTLLTPVFTPPLDTAVGGSRTTVQLVKVTQNGGDYSFDFTLLKKFIETAKRRGIKAFEVSHLFSQWGAAFAPKVMAFDKQGGEKQLFGWGTPALSFEYKEFLGAFLPKLKRFLSDIGVFEQSFFHISDEPNNKSIESYSSAKKVVSSALGGGKIIDAVSEYPFYEKGLVDNIVAANDRIDEFIEKGAKNLWTYYCCGQTRLVSNRFMAMPSYRNRILGVQMFRHDVKGFLHWGYNFWNSMLSLFPIDPYRVTDADGAFPSGDAFLVYPGKDKTAVPSIRQVVFNEALQDYRALSLYRALYGGEAAERKVDTLFGNLSFKEYPKTPENLILGRESLNRDIASRL